MTIQDARPTPPAWRRRFDQVRSIVDASNPDVMILAGLEGARTSLEDAMVDRRRLEDSIAALDPVEIARSLKAALRSRDDIMAADSPAIVMLRERHHLVHERRNRLSEVNHGIESMLTGLDSLGAAVLGVAAKERDASAIDDELGKLQAGADTLLAIHDKLELES